MRRVWRAGLAAALLATAATVAFADMASPRLNLDHLEYRPVRKKTPVVAAVPAAVPAAAPVPVPAAATAETALTSDTLATAEKPPGFRYAIVRDSIVDSLGETLLYVKAHQDAQTSTAVPIPKDRALLAKCITGGTIDDLVRGTVLSARYDPRGVVRPELEIVTASAIEVLDGAKILDRGGARLYVRTAEGKDRGFQIEGGPAGWDSVVVGGKAADLVSGAIVRIEFDPSGREALKIVVQKAAAPVGRPARGCGCKVAGGERGVPAGALLVGLALGGLWLRRRWWFPG